MTPEEIINAITENFLCVRRLPFEVVSYWSYHEGDEQRKYFDANGNLIESKKEVIVQHLDLEHFQNTPTSKFCTDSQEKRFKKWKEMFPFGKKLLKETRPVKNGGWWYVKPVNNTASTINFSREYDKFFAPTLEEAIQLYLNSKK